MSLTDDQIRALLRDPARHPPSARHWGFELIDFSVEAGWAEVAFHPRPEFANPAGAVQGGFVCAMLDDAMSVAASISQRFDDDRADAADLGELPAPDADRRASSPAARCCASACLRSRCAMQGDPAAHPGRQISLLGRPPRPSCGAAGRFPSPAPR